MFSPVADVGTGARRQPFGNFSVGMVNASRRSWGTGDGVTDCTTSRHTALNQNLRTMNQNR
jgi:hypothetical protein